jgi:AcrR family transcriptional regulator
MLDSASALIRERGAAATSLDDILRHSGAPRGSVYYHFPSGRAQLLEETVRRAGGAVGGILSAAAEATPREVFDAFIALWRLGLEGSGFRAGCPVLAVAIESDESAPQLAEATHHVFAHWEAALVAHLRHHGAGRVAARRLATLVVAAVEGAVALSRVERSPRPLDDVAHELRPLLDAAVA